MKKMRKVNVLVSALLSASVALFGCGGSSDSGSDDSDFPAHLAQWTGDQNYKSPTALPELKN